MSTALPSKLLILTDLVNPPHLWMQMLKLSDMEIHLQDHTFVSDELSAADLAGYDMILLYLKKRVRRKIQICRQLRCKYANPLLVILPEKNENLLLSAYAAGADECLVQPMSNLLFLTKVNAWLRRAKMDSQSSSGHQ